jgi:lipid-binding SYLF domain-containing protein
MKRYLVTGALIAAFATPPTHADWPRWQGRGAIGVFAMKALRALGLISFSLLAFVAAPQTGEAGSATEINAAANATLQSFVAQNPSARELGRKAAGVLVFPSILKAGIGLGGEYGEGVLIVKGNAAGYYNIISASFGFQLGVESRSLIIMFMTEEALAGFQNAYGWKVGVDGSIVVVTVGAGGSIDTETLTSPIIAFILDPQGLMYNLSLEGSKISRITR